MAVIPQDFSVVSLSFARTENEGYKSLVNSEVFSYKIFLKQGLIECGASDQEYSC
jgi:hypothetical protein